MTKITLETDGAESPRMVSIDDILAMLIDKEAENQKKSYFEFIKTHDAAVMKNIKKYTLEVKDMDFSGLDEEQTGYAIEETAADLTDSITKANFDYLKHGMKLGIRMLFDLMV